MVCFLHCIKNMDNIYTLKFFITFGELSNTYKHFIKILICTKNQFLYCIKKYGQYLYIKNFKTFNELDMLLQNILLKIECVQ